MLQHPVFDAFCSQMNILASCLTSAAVSSSWHLILVCIESLLNYHLILCPVHKHQRSVMTRAGNHCVRGCSWGVQINDKDSGAAFTLFVINNSKAASPWTPLTLVSRVGPGWFLDGTQPGPTRSCKLLQTHGYILVLPCPSPKCR